MKFDYISDLHIDGNPFFKPDKWSHGYMTLNKIFRHINEITFFDWQKNKQSDILVIAGDITNHHVLSAKILEEAARNYEQVIFVDGNHDHYSTKNDFDRKKVQEYFESIMLKDAFKKVQYLSPGKVFTIDDTSFVGSCGWYNFMSVVNMLYQDQKAWWMRYNSDSRCISFDFQPDILAMEHAGKLKNAINSVTTDKCVVITHTAPNRNCLVQDVKHDWYLGNGSYHNTFMDPIWQTKETAEKISLWLFGHTHERKDFRDGPFDVRFLSNPRGYFQEFPEPRFQRTIEI